MTLAELFTTLESRGLIPKRAPAKKSSLRHLAKALGYPTLETCPVGEACRDPAQWAHAMETYCLTPTPQGRVMGQKNRDNILTDLRGFFKLAEAQGLLTAPLPVRLLKATSTRTAFERSRRGTSPYQDTYRHKTPYSLKQAQWPDDIQQGFQTYTDALEGRLRERSLLTYVYALETYFGYLAHVQAETPTWEKLFRVDLLRQFVDWHGARLGREGGSAHGLLTVRIAAAIARVLDSGSGVEQPTHPKLAAYSRRLHQTPPPPLRDKLRHHWATLADIEIVANSLIAEGRLPYVARGDLRHGGARRALRFQLGLIIKLLIRVPLRQRNIRELHYPHNLWQDKRTGDWALRFRGKELKVDRRNDRTHVFEVPLSRLYPKDGPTPDDLIPTLEEFIKDFRPLLPNGKPGESPSLFLTSRGNPYSRTALCQEVVTAAERRIGVKLNPHVIRDIAATALLKKTKDYDMVAALLGNTPTVVMKHYAHLIPEEEIALAAGHIGAILRTG